MVLIDWCDTLHFEPRGDGAAAPPRHRGRAARRRPVPARRARAAGGVRHRRSAPTSRSTSACPGAPASAAAAPTPPRRCSRSTASGASTGRSSGCCRSAWRSAPTCRSSSPARNALADGIGERLAPATLAPAWFAVVKPAAGLATGEVFARPEVAERVAAARIAGFSEAIPGVDAEPGALAGNRASTCRRLRDERPPGCGRGSLPRCRTRGVRSLASLRQQPHDGFGKRGLRAGGKRPGAIGSDAERLARRLVGPDVPLAASATRSPAGPVAGAVDSRTSREGSR